MLSFKILLLSRVKYLGLHRVLQLSNYTASTRCYSCINTLEDIRDPKQFNDLVKEFPRPKENLQSILYQVALKSQALEWQPKFTPQRVSADANSKKPMWKVQLSINWPEKFVVEAIASQKNEAEKIAALLACGRLKEYGVLDGQLKPIIEVEETSIDKNAKNVLGNVFSVVAQNLQSKHWHPQYVSQPLKVPGSNVKQGWRSTLSMKWPKNHSVEGIGLRKGDAETVAATKALQWLREQQVLGRGDTPILYSKTEKKAFIESRRAPVPIEVPENVRPMLTEVLQKYEALKPRIDEINASNVLFDEEEQFIPPQNSHSQHKRSSELARRLDFRLHNRDPNVVAMIQKQKSLPIFKKREEILDLINRNQVVVLSGETGCGKTTQIPQYILDEEILRMNGGNCNIVVTQPRRISAISIGHRIADERQETIGDTVGYQVRLQSKFPRGSGSILLCSTGVLLQRLHSDPNLENISHLIVDEIHERGVQTDFLLTLLKNIVHSNPKLKVVLMSATINAEMFSAYFDNCPMILVPGFMYPVTEHYLPEITDHLHTAPRTTNSRYPTVDYNIVVQLIRHIDQSKPPGAILCFLPGWQDIKAIKERLEDAFRRSRSHLICPVHSRLPHDEQKLIFSPPKHGVRKIVLATNVAETSITIDDVVYVIDTGFHKETMYDAQKGVACLETQWISKANAKQRRGRAGRVQPGHCFRLYDRNVHQNFQEYQLPEILRTPLEKVVLDSKLYRTNMLAKDFLSRAPQPPELETIEKAVYDLQQLSILDKEENLTPLGRKVAHFSTHPRLSVALVVAAFFRCLGPVATMTAILSATRDPFHVSMDTREEVKKIKKQYDDNRCSDHLAMVCIYNAWETADEENDYHFCQTNMLHYHGLKFIQGLRDLIFRDLQEARLVDGEEENEGLYDAYSNSEGMIMGALCAAVYPNVIRVYKGDMGKSTIKEKALVPVTLYGMQVAIPKESVVSKETNLPSPWLIYFHAIQSQQRKQILVRDVSTVPSLLLFLCANQKTTMDEFGKDIHITVDDETRMKFSCPKKDAQLLKNCQQCFADLLWYFLATTNDSSRYEESIEDLRDNFLDVLDNIFQLSYSDRRELKE